MPLRITVLLLVLAPALAACGGRSLMAPRVHAPAEDPFAPVSLRVHPLTHVEENPSNVKPGQCAVMLHFELKDAWGDALKAPGLLRVELYRPGAGVTPGIETQELVWEIPEMSNAEYNSGRFDPATRTYRVPLVAADSLLTAFKRGTDSPGWVKLRVVFTPDRPATPRGWLEDEFVVQK